MQLTTVLAGATQFLDLLGTVVGGWLLGKNAAKAAELMAGNDADKILLQGKFC